MILEAEDSCNDLTFSWGSTTATRKWNIHISQILCSDPHKPPQGCLQYFTGKIEEKTKFGTTILTFKLYFKLLQILFSVISIRSFLLWYLGTTGNIYSYNFQGGYHLSDQVISYNSIIQLIDISTINYQCFPRTTTTVSGKSMATVLLTILQLQMISRLIITH